MKAIVIFLLVIGVFYGSISFASGTVAKEKISTATMDRVNAIDAALDEAK